MGASRVMSGESTSRLVVVVTGESTCRSVFVVTGESTSAMGAEAIVMRKTSAVRAMMKTDTARWREFVFFGWSSKDGYRSQGSDEKSEEGGEMHAGYC